MTAALVLAAGSAQRYGYANKLLAPLHGVPLLAHTLQALTGAGLRSIVVVTGPSHTRVHRLCRRETGRRTRLRLVRNRDHRQGMAGSLRTGINALPDSCSAALICLGDMPCLDPRLIQRLRRSWRPGLDTIRPMHRGQPGHPVLVSRALFPALRGLRGDRGAQSVLSTVPEHRRRFLVGPYASIADIDTPAALRETRRLSTQPNRRVT